MRGVSRQSVRTDTLLCGEWEKPMRQSGCSARFGSLGEVAFRTAIRQGFRSEFLGIWVMAGFGLLENGRTTGGRMLNKDFWRI